MVAANIMVSLNVIPLVQTDNLGLWLSYWLIYGAELDYATCYLSNLVRKKSKDIGNVALKFSAVTCDFIEVLDIAGKKELTKRQNLRRPDSPYHYLSASSEMWGLILDSSTVDCSPSLCQYASTELCELNQGN
ncbi:hypothetical protein QYF36_009341 [Acer negundo]|nr:hypothetical protein QYF36_009341 [Acer negundo]